MEREEIRIREECIGEDRWRDGWMKRIDRFERQQREREIYVISVLFLYDC